MGESGAGLIWFEICEHGNEPSLFSYIVGNFLTSWVTCRDVWTGIPEMLSWHVQLRLRIAQYAVSLRGNTVLPSVGGLHELSHWNRKFLLEKKLELMQRLLEIPAAMLYSVTFSQLCAFRQLHVRYRPVHLWFCMRLTDYAVDLLNMLRFNSVFVKRTLRMAQCCASKCVWLRKCRQVE
jgi:hypothetical protein